MTCAVGRTGTRGFATDAATDVLVVVHNVEDVGMVSANRGGRETYKRDLLVVDASGFSVRTTLWGQQAQEFPAQGNPVVAFRNIKVTSFGGTPARCTVTDPKTHAPPSSLALPHQCGDDDDARNRRVPQGESLESLKRLALTRR